MFRKYSVFIRKVLVDLVFNFVLVIKLINIIMFDGKKLLV